MIRPLAAALRSSLAMKVSQLKTRLLWRGIRPRREGLVVAGCPPPPERTPQQWHSSPLSCDAMQGFALHYLTEDKLGVVEGDYAKQLQKLKTRLVILGTHEPRITPDEIMNDPRLDLKNLPLLSEEDVSECIKKYISLLYQVEAVDGYFQCMLLLATGEYIKMSTRCNILIDYLCLQHVFPNLGRYDLGAAVSGYFRLCKEYYPSSSEGYVQLCEDYDPSSSVISKNELVLRIKRDRVNALMCFYTNGLFRTLLGTQ